MKLNITQAIIDKAERLRHSEITRGCRCPVALALRAKGYPRAWCGSVLWHLSPSNIGTGNKPMALGTSARELVQQFDHGLKCHPGTVDVQGPGEPEVAP